MKNGNEQSVYGVNPFQEIPGIWFEIYKTQYLMQYCMVELPSEDSVINKACNFALNKVRKKFPKLDFSFDHTFSKIKS